MEKLRNQEEQPKKNHSLSTIEYGTQAFDLEEMPSVTEKMVEEFKDYFSNKNYSEIDPVKISSGVDKSVRFIGSHVSPMKPYFLNDDIPENGLMMSQPCLRTRNQAKLFDDTYIPKWGSYFESMGVLVKPEQKQKLFYESLDYLLNTVKIPPEKLVLRINNNDEDLYEMVQEFKDKIDIEENAMPEKYYQHKIGVNGVSGRNFNYSLKTENGLSDIGNFIYLENEKEGLGVELALGTSTILKEYLNLEHVNSANPVVPIEKIDSEFKYKFEDTIITSVTLLSEGLRPGGKENKSRILRSYIRGIIYFKNKLELSINDVLGFIKNYENSQKINNEASEFLKDYLQIEELEIQTKTELSSEEKEVYSSINKNNL